LNLIKNQNEWLLTKSNTRPTPRNEPYFALDLLAQTFSSTSQMKLWEHIYEMGSSMLHEYFEIIKELPDFFSTRGPFDSD
jgi:hypothetical protein